MKALLLFDNWANADTCLWLSSGEEGKIQVWPCKMSKRKSILTWIFTVLTAGLLRLFFYWKPLWHALATCDICEPENAEQMLVKYENDYYLRVVRMAVWPDGLTLFCPGGGTLDVPSCKYFSYKKMTFLWHPLVKMFHKIFGFDTDVPLTLLASQKGLTSSEANKRLAIFGSNEIAVDLKPIVVLLFREVFSPFYLFQVFSVAVWFSEGYTYYAVIIIVVSLISITVTVWQTRRNQKKLRNMMYSIGIATVWRDGEWKKKSTSILVPGDIIYLPDMGEMHCDAVLLRGSAIVNEAMLTGESVPTTKAPVRPESAQPDERYDSKEHAKHTLFCGTKILQTKHAPGEPVTAVVIRTGFSTTKGRLVRTIMYPKAAEFGFSRDLFRFIAVLSFIAIGGFIYTIVLMVRRHNSFHKIATRSLDIITIVVPPALPAAITIGIIAAQSRLKKAYIYCTSPATINVAGGINVACFDKTGTLTEEGLDLFGVISADGIEAEQSAVDVSDLPTDSEMINVMASCHSLTQLNNQLAGDPMDTILFEKTGWQLEENNSGGSRHTDETSSSHHDGPASLTPPHEEDYEGGGCEQDVMIVRSPDHRTRIRMLREFQFTSSLRRMSVFVHTHCSGSADRSGLFLFCKGAPETIAGLCTPDSVPGHFEHVLTSYAKCGYRVIAVASKQLNEDGDVSNAEPFMKMSRLDLERDMKFLGFVIFENRLKDQTVPNINILKNAKLRTVMVTGDNMLTAVSVAKECGLLDDRRPIYTIEAELINDQPKISLRLETQDAERVVTSARKRNDEAVKHVLVDLDDVDRRSSNKKRRSIAKDDVPPGMEATYQLAIAGSSYAVITTKAPHLLPKLTAVCDVYARMAPEQKIQLVTNLQEIGYIVSMCGDGANDCGALKAAHVGCSLSEAEASIASPFTSKIPDIRCVPILIREGRASLVTTFCIVKYMIAYSLTQFFAVVILYWIGSNLGDLQFLYSDLILTTTYAIFFGYTRPSNFLSPIPPPTQILTISSVVSILAQMVWVLAFQVFAFDFVKLQPWFVPFVFPNDENNYVAYQTTTVFLAAAFQQIVLCIVYSKSHPYRMGILNNYLLSGAIVLTTVATILLVFCPGAGLTDVLNLKLPPSTMYRVLMIILALLHFFLGVGTERVVEWVMPYIEPRLPFRGKKPVYAEILSSDVAISPNWLRAKLVVIGDEENGGGGRAAQVDKTNGHGYGNEAFQSTEEV